MEGGDWEWVRISFFPTTSSSRTTSQSLNFPLPHGRCSLRAQNIFWTFNRRAASVETRLVTMHFEQKAPLLDDGNL